MANLAQLRKAAREIFEEALHAVDAEAAVRRAVQFTMPTLSVGDLKVVNRRIYAVALGKAASAMAIALDEILGESLAGGVLVDPRHLNLQLEPILGSPWICCDGGHPLPNIDSVDAAARTLELLERANSEHALVIFLISGGGSAMIEWPANSEINLGDIRVASKALVACGASIGEINAVRRAFSAIKGGRLAVRASNCDQITLIISDVPDGQEWNVASGPTLAAPESAPRASEVIEKYQLHSQLPEPILRVVARDEPTARDDSTKLRVHFVLLNNNYALEAAASAAQRRGFTAEIARDISDEPIESGCEKLLQRLTRRQPTSKSEGVALSVLSGGEFACPVKGDGLGGRNLETALRLAINANVEGVSDFVALCAGTDGIDGNSPAAGAIVDSTTIERAHRIGLDSQDFLNRSDAYSFFIALGDAITTGPTRTNVRDLRILLQHHERKQINT